MIVIYDVNVFPGEIGITFEQLIKVKEDTGFILWDSGPLGEGIEPKVIFAPEEEKIALTLIDIRDEKNKEVIEKLNLKG